MLPLPYFLLEVLPMNVQVMVVAKELIDMADNGALLKGLEASVTDTSLFGYRTSSAGNALVVDAMKKLCMEVVEGVATFEEHDDFMLALQNCAERTALNNQAIIVEMLPETEFRMEQYTDLVDLIATNTFATTMTGTVKMLTGITTTSFDIEAKFQKLNEEFLRRVHFSAERWVLTNHKLGELYHFQVIVPLCAELIEVERGWLQGVMFAVSCDAMAMLQKASTLPLEAWKKIPTTLPLEVSKIFAGRAVGAFLFDELVDECIEVTANSIGECIGGQVSLDVPMAEVGSKSMLLVTKLPSTVELFGEKAVAMQQDIKDRLFDSNGKAAEDRMTVREYFAFYAETFVKHHQ